MFKTVGELRGILDGLKGVSDKTPLSFAFSEKGGVDHNPCIVSGLRVTEGQAHEGMERDPAAENVEVGIEIPSMTRTINFKFSMDGIEAKPDQIVFLPPGLSGISEIARQITEMAKNLDLRVFIVPNTITLEEFDDDQLAGLGLQRIPDAS